MNETELKELNGELLKGIGIKKIYYAEYDEVHEWPMFIPSGKPWRTHKIDAIPIPNFTADFNTCLKWIMPVINGYITMDRANVDRIWVVEIAVRSDKPVYRGVNESLPLAFCMAADKFLSKVK